MDRPALITNPHDEVLPDYTSDIYIGVLANLTAAGLTEARAAQVLADAWLQENNARRIQWDQQQAAEEERRIEAGRREQEERERARREEEEERIAPTHAKSKRRFP